MHRLLDTHLGFVVACVVQVEGAETTAPICEWMGSMKLFLDLRHFLGRLWPCSGCLLSFTCFSRSHWAMTLLLTARGAIPARRYKFSTLVGCRHPVMARQTRSALGQPCVRALIFPTLGMHIQPWSSRELELLS